MLGTSSLETEILQLPDVPWQGAAVPQVLEVGTFAHLEKVFKHGNVLRVGLTEKDVARLPDCAFDRVMLKQALEFCPWPEALLREVWRIARPDGVVVAVVQSEKISKPELLEMMVAARLRVLELRKGGYETVWHKFLPWCGRYWLVAAQKDVLNVRPLPVGGTLMPKKLGKPAGAGVNRV